MKNKLFISVFLLLIVHCTLIIDNCMCQWTQLPYFPESGYALASTSGNRVYAGCYKYGVFVTTDNGSNWTQTSLSLQYGNDSVLIDAIATNGNYIYAGDNGWVFGFHVSTDYGSTWNLTLTTDAIVSLAVSGSTVYAGGYDDGVFRSTNNGSTWTQTSLTGQCINALSISGSNIYAGTINNGVYISTNVGVNWTKTSLGNHNIWSLASSGSKIYAGSSSGMYYSTNNGSNWTQIGLTGRNVFSIALSGNNIFAGTDIGFSSSINNGINWTDHNDGFVFGTALLHSVLVINNYIIVGTEGWGIFRRPMLEVIGVWNISTEIPSSFKLFQNYPNPFNPTTNIKYQIANNNFVMLKVYDIQGKEIATLVNEKQVAGTYEVSFDASNFSSGIYFYSLFADGMKIDTKKMVFLK
ncbi:MAG: T9SS type A sorting domain-containing protein [Ignavibacteriae bacterium]|nr:T9SS type A sorting domain-containing protein [Ignavibacteriota bacterium]